MKVWVKPLVLLLMGSMACYGAAIDGKTIQAQLDAGENIALKPGDVVVLKERLKFTAPDQRIETVGAETAADYAKIVHAEGPEGTLIHAVGIPGATLSKLILDGNRQGLRTPDGKVTMEPMLDFGGEGAVGQRIEKCFVVEGRCAGGWGAIHVQEGGKGIVIRDNVVFSAGADIRGNGRSPFEKPFGWGDGISTASRDTLIENNLIVDATDEGIMLQGAPGSLVRSNVVVALSREMLGGIALIEPFKYYEMDADKKTYDYRGIVIEDNLVLALGGRVHAAFPMGGSPWNANFTGTTLVGATVRNNRVSGGAGGYGFVVDGVDGFKIEGNTSDATYSGHGDGNPGLPPDAPLPFMFNPSTIGNSSLQNDFQPMEKSLTGVLRASRSPKDSRNALGYRDQPYPDEEVGAVVEMAFIEMLGREPEEAESRHWKTWLQETRSNADMLRCNLLATPEFVQLHGSVDPLELHRWRSARWLNLLTESCSEEQVRGKAWPDAQKWYKLLRRRLRVP